VSAVCPDLLDLMYPSRTRETLAVERTENGACSDLSACNSDENSPATRGAMATTAATSAIQASTTRPRPAAAAPTSSRSTRRPAGIRLPLGPDTSPRLSRQQRDPRSTSASERSSTPRPASGSDRQPPAGRLDQERRPAGCGSGGVLHGLGRVTRGRRESLPAGSRWRLPSRGRSRRLPPSLPGRGEGAPGPRTL
jgi:hypothetical protein